MVRNVCTPKKCFMSAFEAGRVAAAADDGPSSSSAPQPLLTLTAFAAQATTEALPTLLKMTERPTRINGRF